MFWPLLNAAALVQPHDPCTEADKHEPVILVDYFLV